MRDMRKFGKDNVFLSEDNNKTMIEIINNDDSSTINNPNIAIGFHSKDLKAKRKEFESLGLNPTPIIKPRDNVEFFYVKDPAGMNVQFINAFYLD